MKGTNFSYEKKAHTVPVNSVTPLLFQLIPIAFSVVHSNFSPAGRMSLFSMLSSKREEKSDEKGRFLPLSSSLLVVADGLTSAH